jgi:hypothetical protein
MVSGGALGGPREFEEVDRELIVDLIKTGLACANAREKAPFRARPCPGRGAQGEEVAKCYVLLMTPRARPVAVAASTRVKLAAEDERRLLVAVEHAARGETLKLTPEETARYYATGELPERVERWAASRE